MKRYKYTITDLDGGTGTRTCKYEPDGWENYGVTFGRETNISNVVKGYVADWTFVKEDARYLRNILLTKGANNRLRLDIYDLTKNLATSEELVYSGFIDLTQANFDANTFSAPTNEAGFFKALENRRDDAFEIPLDRYCSVDGAVFADTAVMSGLKTNNSAKWNPQLITRVLFLHNLQNETESSLNDTFVQNTELLPMYANVSNTAISASLHNPTQLNENHAFFISKTKIINKLKITYDIQVISAVTQFSIGAKGDVFKCRHRLELYGVPLSVLKNVENPAFLRYQINDDKQYFKVLQYYDEDITLNKIKVFGLYGKYQPKFNGEFEINDFDTNDDNGMAFFIVVNIDLGAKYMQNNLNTTPYMQLTANEESYIDYMTTKNYCTVEYHLQINHNKTIAAIRAVDVFRELINKINDGKYNVKIDTTAFESVAGDDLLTSGEGLRDNVDLQYRIFTMHGKLTTSLTDFLKYAYTIYNYQFAVDFNKNANQYIVYLGHYDTMYQQAEISTITQYGELHFEVEREMLYSTINVGYEIDNDTLDGIHEFNNLQTWTTPNTEIEGKILDLVSPYQAAARVIETYLFENYKNYEDSDSGDSDIYLINATEIGEYAPNAPAINAPLHALKREIVVTAGVSFPETQWNVKYTPKRMLMAHRRELNSYFALDKGKKITLETCDYNRDLVADGITEAADVVIGKSKLFVPIKVTLNAIADISWIAKIENNRLGYVRVKFGDDYIKGFIADGESSVSINPIKPSESEFVLILMDSAGL